MPMKIISLVPSITELLFDLGLNEEVAGITRFCVRPQEWFRSKTRIGGPKNIDIQKIQSLRPDWILASKEENVKEQIEQLHRFQVLLTDVATFEDALQMIRNIGLLVHKKDRGEALARQIVHEFSKLSYQQPKTAAYLIWRNPYLTVGGDTFIHSMMQKAGFENVFGHQKRYPATSLEALQQVGPEYILLSTEPYPFKEKHARELQPLFPHSKVMVADGEMFSWYGSRMLQAADYFKTLV